MSDIALFTPSQMAHPWIWRSNTAYLYGVQSTEAVFDSAEQQKLLDTTASITMRIESLLTSVLADGMAYIRKSVSKIVVPDEWLQDGIAPPSQKAKKLAEDLLELNFVKRRILPSSVTASVEEGVALTYRRQKGKISVFIEVFNEGEISGLVLKGRKVIAHRELHGTQDVALNDLLAYL